MDDTRFVEFVTDDPNQRGYFVPIDKLKQFINANVGRVMYHSYYLYGPEIVRHMETYRTLKGFSGPRFPYRTILDIDAKDDLPGAARTTLEIYQLLSEYYELAEHNIQLWFSGGKGFHVHLPNVFGLKGGPDLPATMKASLSKVFSRWNEHLDLKPVVSTGLIRCPWSAHSSGNIKVPLELRAVQAIAEQVVSVEAFADETHFRGQFEVISEPMDADDDGALASEVVYKEANKNYQQLNDMDNPNAMVTCMQKLLLRGPISGRRHKDALRLVSNWRRQGIPASFSALMIVEWLELDPESSEAQEFRKIVRDVYTQQYAYSCRDEVMAEYCDSKCIFFANKDYVLEVSDNQNMIKDYKDYLEMVESRGVDLKALFGFPGQYKILPGEVMIITGDTGMGKSAFVQTVTEKVAQPTLYLNLEMHEALIYRRFLQIQFGLTKEEINRNVKDGADFSHALDWLHILSVSPDVSDLERLISQRDYNIVVVDTSDGIRADEAGNSDYRKLGIIINTLRNIAQNKNITVILIHHIKKIDPSRTRLTLNDLSGNRDNVTKMDHVFAIEDDRGTRLVRSLKTRDGGQIQLPFEFDFTTMTYKRDPHYEQRAHSHIELGSS